ncbi:MAG TPA: alpha/beta fold hydrolase [Gaiellaceae bacterium]|nr:alpha/beta fold hydrolase [Gaiellaceae bacterium]
MTPVLVLPSSLGTSTDLWERNVGLWSDTFRVLPYDQRGRTSVEQLGRDLLELLDDSGIERAAICGVSLGGATAMWVAASEPERVDRLVLACTSARFGEPAQWVERAAVVREQGLDPIADSIVARWFTAAAPEELVARFRAQLVATPPDDYARCCEALARWDFRERLGEIQAPTLVVGGAEDPAAPLEHQRLLAERIPRARFAVLDDAAHLANVERAEPFSRLVADHLTAAAVEVA